jgi:hypothetical protein
VLTTSVTLPNFLSLGIPAPPDTDLELVSLNIDELDLKSLNDIFIFFVFGDVRAKTTTNLLEILDRKMTAQPDYRACRLPTLSLRYIISRK